MIRHTKDFNGGGASAIPQRSQSPDQFYVTGKNENTLFTFPIRAHFRYLKCVFIEFEVLVDDFLYSAPKNRS